MTQAKTLLDALQGKVAGQVNEEKTRTAQAIVEHWERLVGMCELRRTDRRSAGAAQDAV